MYKITFEQDILDVVRSFARSIGVDGSKISIESTLQEIGIDSLRAVGLIFEIEDRYNISLPMDEFRASTVQEAIEFLRPRLPQP